MPKTETYKCNKCHATTDSFASMIDFPHSCGGKWQQFDWEFYAQQRVQLTALRRGLALSILFNVVLLAVVLATIGGN